MKKIQSIEYPRYTTTQRNALTNVVSDTIIYNTTTSTYEMWNGSIWVIPFNGINSISTTRSLSELSSIPDGTIVINTSFINALSIGSDCTLMNCATNGLTINGTFNQIQGGEHTTIASNGNNNQIQNVRKSTSITVGAVTGNIVTGNYCDTLIVVVAGNEFNNNTEY